MLLLLIAWLYITFICFSWGNTMLRLLTGMWPGNSAMAAYWPFVCLAGMTGIGAFAGIYSIFQPIGLAAHLLVLIPVIPYLIHVYRNKRPLSFSFRTNDRRSWLSAAVTCSSLLLILVINTQPIIHPDTVLYHAPFVKWMETYKAIPGIVLYDPRLGYQSAWFGLIALFRFDFIVSNHWVLINGCVAGWLLLFLCRQLFQPGGTSRWLWFVLLLVSVVSWPLVRLTAASASPDLIAALLVWACLYAYLRKEKDTFFSTPLIVVLGCGAVAIKLSVFFIVVIPVIAAWSLLRKGQFKKLAIALFTGLLLLLPGVGRSIINAGFPLYPSGMADLFEVDWKATAGRVQQEEHYINAYARFPVADYEQGETVYQMPPGKWIGPWWHHLALTDQCLLLIAGVLLLYHIFSIRQLISRLGKEEGLVLAVATAGSIVWFIKFPDPRFGYGFLIPLLLLLLKHTFSGIVHTRYSDRLFKPVLLTCTVCLLAYSGYRLLHYKHPSQFITPAGILSSPSDGFSPVPNRPLPPGVTERGDRVEDGFKNQ